ncbi:MAG: glycosyltransferase [Candidatus Omnitrophica bacterium]|nr:glycosyltransferase [Candidatus Omnitrophota bacterium]
MKRDLLKKIMFPIDAVLFLVIYCALAVFTTALYFIRPFRVRCFRHPAGRMLEFAHYGIEDIERQGLSHTLFRYDLGGYLKNTVTVIFSVTAWRVTDKRYGPSHRIVAMPQQPEGILKRMGFNKTNFALSVIRLLSKCIEVAREEKVTFFRAQDPHMLGLAAFLCSAYAGIPYTIHVLQNYDISTRRVQRIVFPPFIFKRVEDAIERMILKKALFVTAGCANYRFYALSHGARPEDVYASRMPPGEAHLKEPGARRDLKAELGIFGKRAVLYVGRLEKVKFVEDLILCFGELASSVRDAKLVIAGAGSLEKRLRSMAREMGLDKDVIFLGKTSQEKLVDLYYSADVILFTHAGVTIIEALLSGRPVASYDHDWAGEVLGCNERGLLAPFRDYKGLASCVARLLADKTLSSRLGETGRAFAAEHFTRKVINGIERAAFERYL